jgi:hypothetical protein
MAANSDRSARIRATVVGFIAVILGGIVAIAILYRPGSFSVVAKSQGNSIELTFAESRVDLNEILDRLLSQTAGNDTEATKRRRLIAGILQAHGFYHIPSEDAVLALRGIHESDSTRPFIRAVRGMLYDLAGPFSRPATFLEAPDDRVLLALNDLLDRNPASPLLARLWEESLDFKGIFSPREISIVIREDRYLSSGVAATCAGSILLNRTGQVINGDLSVPLRFARTKPCSPTSAEDMLAGKVASVWISQHDMHALTDTETTTLARESGLQAKLVPLPVYLTAIEPGQ